MTNSFTASLIFFQPILRSILSRTSLSFAFDRGSWGSTTRMSSSTKPDYWNKKQGRGIHSTFDFCALPRMRQKGNFKLERQIPGARKTMFILFPSFQGQHDSDHSLIESAQVWASPNSCPTCPHQPHLQNEEASNSPRASDKRNRFQDID